MTQTELINSLSKKGFKPTLHVGCTKSRHLQIGIHAVINARAGRSDLNDHTDKEWHMIQLAYRINTPRLIIRKQELGEWKRKLTQILPDRFTTE